MREKNAYLYMYYYTLVGLASNIRFKNCFLPQACRDRANLSCFLQKR